MPDNTEAPAAAQTPETPKDGTPPPPEDTTTEAENLKNRNEVLEELLRQVNIALDGSNSIFPGSHLHEDIHLAVTGQRL